MVITFLQGGDNAQGAVIRIKLDSAMTQKTAASRGQTDFLPRSSTEVFLEFIRRYMTLFKVAILGGIAAIVVVIAFQV